MRPLRDRLGGALGKGSGDHAGAPLPGDRAKRTEMIPLREEYIAADHLHGADRLQLAGSVSFPALALLAGDPELAGFSLADSLFLDTETTGLAGGAGTMVFICGTARFVDDGRLLVRQHFLTGPGSEVAFLGGILDDLAATRLLVTFSGKSFDRHRLADRFVLHGLAETVRKSAHLDLLHSSRRVYKRYLPDTKLRTLEERVLKLLREDDLPGSECPRLYLDWLRGHAVDLEPAFVHNRLDVLSLVTLMARLGQDPEEGQVARPLLVAHAERHKRESPERAARYFGRAGRELDQGLALVRAGQVGPARKIFEKLVGLGDRQAFLPLGRLLLHSCGEPDKAAAVLDLVADYYPPGEKEFEAARRLLARIRR